MSNLDILVSNLETIHTEVMTKIIAENIRNGITIFGITGTVPTNCKTFSTVEEMTAYTGAQEDDYAIVYGLTYVGTYRYDSGSWTQIGDSSDAQKTMDVLNEVLLPVVQYEGNGGTDAQISALLDDILGLEEV